MTVPHSSRDDHGSVGTFRSGRSPAEEKWMIDQYDLTAPLHSETNSFFTKWTVPEADRESFGQHVARLVKNQSLAELLPQAP